MQGLSRWKKNENLIMPILFVIIITLICTTVGIIFFNAGYKKGQLDYAQDYIKYTVIEGRIIKFMGTVKEVTK